MESIWSSKSQVGWPIDFGQYHFIGRAVLMVGRWQHGDDWSDDDPTQVQTGGFLKKAKYSIADLQYNWRLIKHVIPLEEHEALPKSTSPSVRPPRIPPEVWALATTHLARLNEAKVRYKSVQHRMLSLFRSGEVQTGIRPYRGGDISPVPPSFWNGENLEERFEVGLVDAKDPFSDIHSDFLETCKWIFVEKQSLKAVIQSITVIEPSSEQPQQSDLLRFAIAFNERYWDCEFPTKPHLVAMIDSEWARLYPAKTDLWGRIGEDMATILRTYEDRRGRPVAKKNAPVISRENQKKPIGWPKSKAISPTWGQGGSPFYFAPHPLSHSSNSLPLLSRRRQFWLNARSFYDHVRCCF